MVGLMQIMIYLLCIYLVYKGAEIFQIALVSNSPNKNTGITIGIIAIAAAVVISLGAFLMTESMVSSIGENMNRMPNLR